MPGGSGTASRKPAGKRKKGKDTAADEEEEDLLIEKVPTENTAVSIKTWGRLREFNPYQFEERTYSRGDKMFWTKTQYCFWEDFYNNPEYTKTGSFVQPKAINQEELNLYAPTEFRFVIETLKKLGLYDLVCLKPGDGTGVYCPDLIRQFHCTAYFHEDPARTITWMSGTEQHSCNYIDFCQAMGFGAGRARGFKIHSEKSFTHGAISFCYPPVPHHPLQWFPGCTTLISYFPRYSVRVWSASLEMQVMSGHIISTSCSSVAWRTLDRLMAVITSTMS
jgi:hypothetical protein